MAQVPEHLRHRQAQQKPFLPIPPEVGRQVLEGLMGQLQLKFISSICTINGVVLLSGTGDGGGGSLGGGGGAASA